MTLEDVTQAAIDIILGDKAEDFKHPCSCSSARRIKKIVDMQAEREDIWFDATSISEAYLQGQIRLIHNVIEDEFRREPMGEEDNATP